MAFKPKGTKATASKRVLGGPPPPGVPGLGLILENSRSRILENFSEKSKIEDSREFFRILENFREFFIVL